MGRINSRAKGAGGEREVISMLQPVVNDVYSQFEQPVPRLQRNTLQSDGGGSDIAGLDWMALEVKFHKDESINQWWAQTLRQAGMHRTPILLFRTNHQPWRCRMLGLLGTRIAGRTCPVTVSIEDFLVWFRLRLVEELS